MEHRQRHAGPWFGLLVVTVGLVAGCEMPSAHTSSRNFSLRGEMPVDPPGPNSPHDEDAMAGGELYKLYCGSCHNARPLGERPFSNYEVAVAHMRDQAYLTGEEYRQIIQFIRRWHDVGPATPPTEPSPKRFIPAQPISELRGEAGQGPTPPPPPEGAGPWPKPDPAAGPPAQPPGTNPLD
jgi:hypothetical protein